MAAEKTPAKSGFCNPANPPRIHGSCRKTNCPCDCGQGVHAAAEPLTWEGDGA